jgi:alkylation response protein AidB-like acyl-CoA dehydrogenase
VEFAVPRRLVELGERLRALTGDAREFLDAVTPDLWRAPAAEGDDRLLEAAIACEEAGRSLCGPPAATALVADWLAAQLGDPDLATMARERRVMLGIASLPSSRQVAARSDRRGWRLSADALPIDGPADAICLVLEAATPAGTGLFVLDLEQPAARRSAHTVLDVIRPACLLATADEGAEVRRIAGDPAAVVDDARNLARLLGAAEMTGMADRALAEAVQYVSTRQQFGRPIGSYQAVAHGCAASYADLELLRALVHGAASRHRGDGVPRPLDAAAACQLALEVCPAVADRAVQALGAEGLRWERPTHLLARRIRAADLAWRGQSSADWLAELLLEQARHRRPDQWPAAIW